MSSIITSDRLCGSAETSYRAVEQCRNLVKGLVIIVSHINFLAPSAHENQKVSLPGSPARIALASGGQLMSDKRARNRAANTGSDQSGSLQVWIEIVQRTMAIICGSLGGIIGALIYRCVAKRPSDPDELPPQERQQR